MTTSLFVKLVAFVIPLGFDTFAVAVLLGIRRLAPLRPAVTFALFEATMPLIGLWLGRFAGARFEAPAQVLGGLILIGVAVHIGREALEDDEEVEGLTFGTLRLAVAAGLGVSMDELAIGFPMGTSGLPIPLTLAAIGAQTFVVTFVGIAAGGVIGARSGKSAAQIASLMAALAFGVLGLYLMVERFVPSFG